jgi:glutaredoxin 3
MSNVTIYTKPYCPYCIRAVDLLEKKGVAFTEIEAAFDPQKRQEMVQRAGGRATFPQIFIGERHIGGCDEMMALERAGELDPLLQAA